MMVCSIHDQGRLRARNTFAALRANRGMVRALECFALPGAWSVCGESRDRLNT
jgi:hypothetical protein